MKRKNRSNDYPIFKAHYDRSLQIRGIFQAAYNNLPAAAQKGTADALQIAQRSGDASTDRFLRIFKQAILDAYKARNDDSSRLIDVTKSGARLR
ncbi:MAG: hypothetical protein HC800_09345 [Phormidesmis sp. RL_2_1]|nr:hypothetical protein [Phormidesmis sp. RL_2_1]